MQVHNPFYIAPSILSADFMRLGEEVGAVIAAGADLIHFDVMDQHYVPNLSFGPMICAAIKKSGVTVPLDVHLMVEPVDALIESFAEAGATYISFHPDASRHVDRSIELIRSFGCKPGLVLNPATPLHDIDWVIDKLDMLLLMSVNPGFGGQKYIPYVTDKLAAARKLIDSRGLSTRLEIDGGVSDANIKRLAEAGADTFVSGSAIFGAGHYENVISNMRKELESVRVNP